MKFSEQWLREWVNPSVDSETLCEQLTMAGLEVDGMEPAAPEFSGVVVGEVLEAVQHPNADKLRLCTVSTGQNEHQIICGAPNARAGIKVAVAEVGAVLPGNFKIKRAKLRGVESLGMLCSESELGLSEEHDGILELPADAPLGQDFREFMKLDDQCIEVDLTPNRGDCLGIRGIALEIGVINQADVCTPRLDDVPDAIDDAVSIELQAPEACPRYVGRIIRGVDPKAKTPQWMVEKLRRSGIRAIYPLVDITNYVLMELGHPMHAFDLREIKGGIRVRYPEANETLVLLDGREVELTEDTLLIADHERPLALAGIMGGEHSGIADDTVDVLLESAWFNPLAIVGKARHYGLHTDASHRYERGVDPELQVTAMHRATQLVLDICGGTAGKLVDQRNDDFRKGHAAIALRRSRIERLLGVSLADEQIEDILTRLELTPESNDEGWLVSVPSHRFDINIEADLIEEIARIYGYNQITAKKSEAEMAMLATPEGRVELYGLKRFLADRGYQEAITYSFVDPELQSLMFPNSETMRLMNPISSDMSDMRISLLPGLVHTLQRNQSFRESRVRLFETGLRFIKSGDDLAQTPGIAGLLYGPRLSENWENQTESVDFYDLKGDLEALLDLAGQDAVEFEAAKHSALHPGQCAAVKVNGQNAGYIGAIHPSVAKKIKLAGPVFLFELDLDVISQSAIPSFTAWSKYPASTRDLAVVVDEEVSASELLSAVESVAGKSLQKARIFDIYRGKGVDLGRKSVALGLIFCDFSTTLTDTEINEVFSKIVKHLSETFNATLRD